MEQIKGIDDAIVAQRDIAELSSEDAEMITQKLINDFELNLDNKEEASYYEIANNFLRDRNLKLQFYQDEFYEYDNGRYIRRSDSDIKAWILKWAQSDQTYWGRVKKNFREEIFVQLQGICYLNSNYRIPCWISNGRPADDILVFGNGYINIADYVDSGEVGLEGHTSDLFTLSKINYNFEENPKDPIKFLDYLNKVQPDPAKRRLLQQWLGYNLIFDTTLEAFMFFLGEGANGKSVFLLIMKLILDPCNVSSVDLEDFKPSSRFRLAATVGKLANIVGDLNDIDKVAEGMLKQFVSGEEIQVERKFKAPFDMKPTARLTYSMNVLPRFTDRSNGIWRRMLIVSWDKIIAEGERNQELLNPEFWKKSGELPGILMWALKGLLLLKCTGHFILPESSKTAISEYKEDSNPTKKFCVDQVIESIGSQVSSRDLFFQYQNWMRDHGYNSLPANHFAQEIKRHFKNVILTPNAVIQRVGGRSRNWIGIMLLK